MDKMSRDFKKKVISLGELSINQCPDFYNNMDMIFFPSNLECFSATPLEALYMKKSIVCSDLPFNKNIIIVKKINLITQTKYLIAKFYVLPSCKSKPRKLIVSPENL